MSIDFEFQNGTSGDLSDQGDNLFSMCIFMMLTGVPKITNDEEADLFTQRITQARIAEGRTEHLPFIWSYTEELKELGITTNISKKTKPQWKTTLYNMIEDRAKAVIREGVTNA